MAKIKVQLEQYVQMRAAVVVEADDLTEAIERARREADTANWEAGDILSPVSIISARSLEACDGV